MRFLNFTVLTAACLLLCGCSNKATNPVSRYSEVPDLGLINVYTLNSDRDLLNTFTVPRGNRAIGNSYFDLKPDFVKIEMPRFLKYLIHVVPTLENAGGGKERIEFESIGEYYIQAVGMVSRDGDVFLLYNGYKRDHELSPPETYWVSADGGGANYFWYTLNLRTGAQFFSTNH